MGTIYLTSAGVSRPIVVSGPVTLNTLLEQAEIPYDAGMDYRTADGQIGLDDVVREGEAVFAAKSVGNG